MIDESTYDLNMTVQHKESCILVPAHINDILLITFPFFRQNNTSCIIERKSGCPYYCTIRFDILVAFIFPLKNWNYVLC